MKYQLENAINTILKTVIFFIFYILVLYIKMYLFSLKYDDISLITNAILNYLNYPVFTEFNFNEHLLFIFNNFYFILYFSFFYIYEYFSIHSSICTRYKSKKWIVHKYIMGLLAIVILSLVEYLIIWYVFKSNMVLNIKYYLYPIVYKTLIMTLVFTIFNSFRTNKLVGIALILVSLIILFKFNWIVAGVCFIITFIINYLFFDLRKFRYVRR